MERTEEQKLAQEPVKVILGGKEYDIKPLPIVRANTWRRQYVNLLKETSVLAAVTADESEKFQDALSKIFLEKPDEFVTLLFDYAPELDRTTIEQEATSVEVLNALEAVIGFETPFLGAALRMTNVLKKSLV
jgi:hypothetical protein